MFELHLAAVRSTEKNPSDHHSECKHDGVISTDGDAIRCCSCLGQLVMVPFKPGEFRLEWLSQAELAGKFPRAA